MSKVRPSAEVSALLKGVVSDLSEHVDKADAIAIRAAVKQLPEDPTVTMNAIKHAGLTPALRGNLLFEMFARQHRDVLQQHIRASKDGIAGVFRSLSGQTVGDDSWDDDAQIDEELARFAEKLLEEDAENVNTGDDTLHSKNLYFDEVEGQKVKIDLDDDLAMSIEREQNDGIVNWRYRMGDEEENHPIANFDLRTLEKILDVLAENAERGAQNPLLAIARTELDQAEGGLLEGSVLAFEKMIAQKREARKEHLAAVDSALRMALGDKAVGRASQDDVNALAEKAMQQGQG